MTQKKRIFGLLEEGRDRNEIIEETGFSKLTVGYYHRQWLTLKAAIEEDKHSEVIAPKYPDDFDLEDKKAAKPKPSNPAPKPTPETEKDKVKIGTPTAPVHNWVKPRPYVAPFFREKQAK